MQAYNRAFAEIYNERWIHFAQNAAPQIQGLLETGDSAKRKCHFFVIDEYAQMQRAGQIGYCRAFAGQVEVVWVEVGSRLS